MAFKVAAEMGDGYLHAIEEAAVTINKGVTENLYSRHIEPIFLAGC